MNRKESLLLKGIRIILKKLSVKDPQAKGNKQQISFLVKLKCGISKFTFPTLLTPYLEAFLAVCSPC